jgi:hypothetical protein
MLASHVEALPFSVAPLLKNALIHAYPQLNKMLSKTKRIDKILRSFSFAPVMEALPFMDNITPSGSSDLFISCLFFQQRKRFPHCDWYANRAALLLIGSASKNPAPD